LGVQVEIDVASYEGADITDTASRGVVTALSWAPLQPPLALAVDLSDFDVFEVLTFNDEEGPRLVAAVELISPRN
jgi:hypothetical protein